ncbi:SseB family protein, partial [Micromonospora sp. URMC 107]|uniref:SseB family protein n=1 Tax=Micromonospora sp. URMC 107 TaxID=3423418 RepID=UPI003F1C7B05
PGPPGPAADLGDEQTAADPATGAGPAPARRAAGGADAPASEPTDRADAPASEPTDLADGPASKPTDRADGPTVHADAPEPGPTDLADGPTGRAEDAQNGADPGGPTGRAEEAGRGADPGGPSVLDLLNDAGARRDLPGYLGILAAVAVCVPLAAEPGPDRDVPWTIVTDPTGAPLLPVFTSPEALTAFAGEGVPFVAVPCADLLADWPDPAWGLVVDAGTPRALALGAPSLAALLAANPPPG